ncbi:hypothetical protein QJQ45_020530 [Haematococcus lacustris]|nr:hypothetical protein QJQ45_020530 [Haematococcus lacustris]
MSDNEEGGNVREQDRFLPIANISRIMKKALPGNAKIAKDAKETVQECVSEFISFITSEASDKCQREKRKTINGDDLLWSMTTLGFEDYVEPLKLYLQKFRQAEATTKDGKKEHKQGISTAKKPMNDDDYNDDDDDDGDDGDILGRSEGYTICPGMEPSEAGHSTVGAAGH